MLTAKPPQAWGEPTLTTYLFFSALVQLPSESQKVQKGLVIAVYNICLQAISKQVRSAWERDRSWNLLMIVRSSRLCKSVSQWANRRCKRATCSICWRAGNELLLEKSMEWKSGLSCVTFNVRARLQEVQLVMAWFGPYSLFRIIFF